MFRCLCVCGPEGPANERNRPRARPQSPCGTPIQNHSGCCIRGGRGLACCTCCLAWWFSIQVSCLSTTREVCVRKFCVLFLRRSLYPTLQEWVLLHCPFNNFPREFAERGNEDTAGQLRSTDWPATRWCCWQFLKNI